MSFHLQDRALQRTISAGWTVPHFIYTSPYMVATPKGYTKHYYAESERVASRIGGGLDSVDMFIRNIEEFIDKPMVEISPLWTEEYHEEPFDEKRHHNLDHLYHAMECTGNVPSVVYECLIILHKYSDFPHHEYEPDCYWYHPDHLGSSSWITFSDGKAVQHLHYLPWGENFVDQRSSTFDGVRYTFSAKEKDAETGYSYFGSRYYNSDLSIWLSVDPMSDKYPNMSPYIYCANNPVKLVDPNGEDFESEIDYENKTITIKATFYTAKCNKGELEKGIALWKEQSGKYAYSIGEGDNKTDFTIIFDLKIEGDFETEDEALSAISTGSSNNIFAVRDNVYNENDEEVRGACVGGNIIYISNHYKNSRTAAHEIGHALGCADAFESDDLMKSGGYGSNIGIKDIRAIMFFAGFDNSGFANVGNGGNGKSCDKLQLGDGCFWGNVIRKQ